jgi:hypothetical protein
VTCSKPLSKIQKGNCAVDVNVLYRNLSNSAHHVPEADFWTAWHICSANPPAPNKQDNFRVARDSGGTVMGATGIVRHQLILRRWPICWSGQDAVLRPNFSPGARYPRESGGQTCRFIPILQSIPSSRI